MTEIIRELIVESYRIYDKNGKLLPGSVDSFDMYRSAKLVAEECVNMIESNNIDGIDAYPTSIMLQKLSGDIKAKFHLDSTDE